MRQGLEVCRVFRVGLPAGRAEAILVCADAVPAKTTDLIAAGTREEVEVIHLEGLHAQRTLHHVFTQV